VPRTPATYPVWSAEPVAVFDCEVVRYKYAVWSAGTFSRWEAFADGQAERAVRVDRASLPSQNDGSPGTTLTVADKVDFEGLVDWDATQLPTKSDGDAAAITAASERHGEDVVSDEASAAASPLKEGRASALRFAVVDDDDDDDEASEEATETIKVHNLNFHTAAERREALLDAPDALDRPRSPSSDGLWDARSPPMQKSPKSGEALAAARAALASFIDDEAQPAGGGAPLDVTDGVVVASLFLPVIVKRDAATAAWDIAWDFESLLSLQAPLRVTRVGVARVPSNTTVEAKAELAKALRRAPWNCIAIFLDDETYDLFYHEFCKGVLWPVFHNSLEVYGERATPGIDDEADALRAEAADAAAAANQGRAPGCAPDDLAKRAAIMEAGAETAAVALLAPADGAKERSESQGSFEEMGDVAAEDDSADSEGRDGRGSPWRSGASSATTRSGTFSKSSSAESASHRHSTAAAAAIKRQRATRVERAWRAYKYVNQIFRDYVVEAYNEGDLIWVHGFQLALLPAFVSRRLTVAKLGLFMHTPFPSSEIFRTLSTRCELLRGILSADQIGFHLFEYARHFLTTCRRLLGVRSSFDARGAVLSVDGRDVVITCVHAGIEPALLSRVANGAAAAGAAERKLATLVGAQAGAGALRVIAGIDRLERLRGLPLKLLAYERFLETRAAAPHGDRVVLVQYAVASRERTADCDTTRGDVDRLVARIRAAHGDDVIVWNEVAAVSVDERLALLRLADVFWVSSVRDGLNRWPLEYVAMQSDVLLGPEAHEDAPLDAAAGARGDAQYAVVRARYFADVSARMLHACGGPTYPCEDPCAFFAQRPQAQPDKAARTALDAELFPPPPRGNGAAEAARGSATAHDDEDSAPASFAGHELQSDADGNNWFTVATQKALSKRERRHLADYLATVPGAVARHEARRARCGAKRVGALLLSENASAARVMLGAVSVNPWRIDESADALAEILGMSDRERAARHARDAAFLARSTTAKWAYRILSDLKALPKDANRNNATHAGLGLNFRVLGMRSGFDALQVDRVARSYRSACATAATTGATGARVLIFDYGGTLVPDAAASSLDPVAAYAIAQGERSQAPKPSGDVRRVLAALAADARNVVFVVSGRERADLIDGLGDLESIPDLGLAAEHGYFLRWPRALGKHNKMRRRAESAGKAAAASAEQASSSPAHAADDAEWEKMSNADFKWRAIALATMEMFAERTQGTYVERHESSLVWQYRDADPDYGEMQAKELEVQLAEALAPFPAARVLRGENPSQGGYVEVRPAGVDKGATVARVLKMLQKAGRAVEFALVVGDDASDEPMFRALAEWQRGEGSAVPPQFRHNSYSVCIGKKPSEAECYVDTHDNLLELLQALARVSNRGTRSHSSVDLHSSSAARLSAFADDEMEAPAEPDDASETPSSTASIGRSFSMPVFVAEANTTPKVPSWVSFQQAIAEDDEPEDEGDDDVQESNAAMFF